MEVHHHSSPAPGGTHIERKKFTHYLWEFLMLFLAVFCGFLAENQREHMVENQREKQYIRSLISDVKTDTANLTTWTAYINLVVDSCNYLLNNFDAFTKDFSLSKTETFLFALDGYPDFIYTDRTIQQLKNSGGMRLIRNAAAADSIIAYDASARQIQYGGVIGNNNYKDLHDLNNNIFSYQKFEKHGQNNSEKKEIQTFWLKQDPGLFEHLYNLIYKYKRELGWNSILQNQLKNKGSRLIDFLQKEYNMPEKTPLEK